MRCSIYVRLIILPTIIKPETRLFKYLVRITIVAFVSAFVLPPEAIASPIEVKIPAGTTVILKTNTTLIPNSLNPGDTISLSVVNDVIVDGSVVIAAGAAAKGEITNAKDRGMIGIAAEIGFTIRSVQAVDGSTVMLSGAKNVSGKDKMVLSIGLALVCCILFAVMKGGDANIPSGTQIEAMVASTTTISI